MSTSRSSMNLATLYSASALPRLAAFMYQLNASESGEPDFTKEIITGIDAFAFRLSAAGENPSDYFRARRELWEDKVLVITDVSQGVVPIDKDVRAAREANGRLMIYLAGEAKQVHRVFCGIGKRIK